MHGQTTLAPPPAFDELREQTDIALFLDFDGTLVEIADGPEAIDVPTGLGQRLCVLRDRLGGRLALVSGRAIPNLESHLGELPIARAGSHGIARKLADGTSLGNAPEALPAEAVAKLETFAKENGLLLETKPHGAALHYRNAPELAASALTFAEAVAADHGLSVKRGKCVIELVRPGADKGGAVAAFMQIAPFADATPVFIGDDITDEDGFAAAEALGGFGILVGDRMPSSARYRLANTVALSDWLSL